MNARVPTERHASWLQVCGRGLISGSAASVVSLAALALLSQRETGSAATATNATSHWLWGDRALRKHDFSLRYTALGYGIHHLSSVFWAVIYERWLGRRRAAVKARPHPWRDAALVSALACATDYLATPKRLTPGFEHHLSKPALAVVYVAFTAGLGLGGWLCHRGERQLPPVPAESPASAPTLH